MSKLEDIQGRFFIGEVVDIKDPKRQGRVRVKVVSIFDDIPVEAIPWASPWKNMNGEDFILPELGKIVTVVFESSLYTPEYIYAEHYNINLTQKLKELSDSDYSTMKSVLFDDTTQMYVNESEGVVIDHKFNNINIKNKSINLNLKDNGGLLNLGDESASESAVLGDRFFRWFDKLVLNLLGSNSGPYLGNLGGQVIPNPDMIKVLTEYQKIRNTFLSDHVKIVDDNHVRKKSRINNTQQGDAWKSTIAENPIQYANVTGIEPMDGSAEEIDDANQPNNPSTSDGDYPSDVVNNPSKSSAKPATPEELQRVLNAMKKRKFEINEIPYQPNIVGVRTKTAPRTKVSNKFDDYMYVFYKDNSGKWISYKYPITTTPGLAKVNGVKFTNLKKNVSMLKLGQYRNQYALGLHQGKYIALVNRTGLPCHAQDETNYYNIYSKDKTGLGINIHKAGDNSVNVYNWSEGCQVFQKISHFNELISICQKWESVKGKGAKFTYTLLSENDVAA